MVKSLVAAEASLIAAQRPATPSASSSSSSSSSAEAATAAAAPVITVPGLACPTRNFWLFPVCVDQPDATLTALNQAGIDAYRGATQVRAPCQQPKNSLDPSPPTLTKLGSTNQTADVVAMLFCWVMFLFLMGAVATASSVFSSSSL